MSLIDYLTQTVRGDRAAQQRRPSRIAETFLSFHSYVNTVGGPNKI